jgi:hypothetical protein
MHSSRLARRALRAVMCLTVIARVDAAVAQGIPDRLADSTFWRLITQFSEPNGFFRSDNFLSNEGEYQYIIPEVVTTVRRGGVYLGVGPEQNFTYILAFEPRIAFICDIRRQNLIQHLLYKAVMELSATRAEFLSRLWSRPMPQGLALDASSATLMDAFSRVPGDSLKFRRNLAAVFRHLVVTHGYALSTDDSVSLRYVYTAIFRAGPELSYSFDPTAPSAFEYNSMPTFAQLAVEDDGNGVNRGWLASERQYRALRDMQLRNLIVPIVGDFAGSKALRAIGSYVRERNATIDVFYVSNVEQYLFQQADDWRRFYENVTAMPTTPTSTFIRSVSNPRWVPFRNPRARMSQVTSPVGAVLTAVREGRALTYYDVIMIRN